VHALAGVKPHYSNHSEDDLTGCFLLLKAGSDFDVVDGQGKMPLHYSSVNRTILTSLLLENGADSMAKDHTSNTLLNLPQCTSDY
jgi:ankyrin repeat protein